MNRLPRTILAALALATLAPLAAAQGTTKPIRIVVPFPAGGPSDTAARSVAQAWASTSGQSVVVENRPGAGGAIAAQAVITAAPDGQTLLWAAASMAALPSLQRTPPFRSLLDLAPLAMAGRFTYVLAVHASVPARSVADLVQHARANPGKVEYATGTLGEYMTTVQFLKAAKVDMLRVPYKGGAQAMPDLVAGRVQVFFTPIQLALPHAKDGKLRILGTVLPQRAALAPDTPTLAEAGYPNVLTPTWQALFAPPRTPREVQAKLAGEILAALRDPDLRARFAQQALAVDALGPEALAKVVADDTTTWKAFIEEYAIPLE